MVHKLPMFGRRIIGGAVDGFFEWKGNQGTLLAIERH
jgi:hypothetical protein